MAKIKDIIKGTGNISKRISDVDCVYNVGDINGEKIVAFSTFGSNARKNEGIASQVIHIDKKCASQMIEIFKKEFGL